MALNDYYPFGMDMPGRSFLSENYRFGYNGKEKDIDFNNIYDYGYRNYDSRIGRFFRVDPIGHEFSMLTPYQYSSNTPIQAIDLDGLEGIIIIDILAMPNEFKPAQFAKDLQADLIANGAHKETKVVINGPDLSYEQVLRYDPNLSARLIIDNYDPKRDTDHKGGGYAPHYKEKNRLYGKNFVVLFKGLSYSHPEQVQSNLKYVRYAMHELGHGIYDFYTRAQWGHCTRGFTIENNNVMDYRSITGNKTDEELEPIGFSPNQKAIIKRMNSVDYEPGFEVNLIERIFNNIPKHAVDNTNVKSQNNNPSTIGDSPSTTSVNTKRHARQKRRYNRRQKRKNK
jgi:RHS repeat-associated protein